MNMRYEKFDGCFGTITSRSQMGVYLTLDNGEEAFAFKFANLRPGTKVLCTVVKEPTDNRKTMVSIDHVCGFAAVA